MDFSEFAKNYGTLTIAVYGVMQLWIISFYKNVLKRPRLSNIRAGKVELGYSEYGPTMGIAGTLLVDRKSLVIANATVKITRKRDGMTHLFTWNAFRNPELLLIASKDPKIEMAYAFLLREGTPHRYNIFFSDVSTQASMATHAQAHRDEWHDYRYKNEEVTKERIRSEGMSEDGAIELLAQEFDKISKTKMALWDITNRNCYWEPGEYSAILEIKSDKDKSVWSEQFRFIIAESHFKSLQLNCVAIEKNIRTENARFNFAYLDYER